MMKIYPGKGLADRPSVEDQAVSWFVKSRSGVMSEEERADYRRWLGSNDEHIRATGELEAFWQISGDFGDTVELRELRTEACKSLQDESDKLPWWDRGPKLFMDWQTRVASSLLTVAMLVVALLGGGMGLQSLWLANMQEGVYETEVGEQLSVRLDDGSELLLDTQTKVLVELTQDRREISLLRGQARFDVAHDKNRPFIVSAGQGSVLALGTAFVVRKTQKNVLVTLIDGRVAVAQEREIEPADLAGAVDSKSLRTLDPGQQLAYSQEGFSSIEQVVLDKETAWQQGRLVFEDHKLKDVIDDLNRYSERKIVLTDASLDDLRITGVFKSGDNSKAIRALESYFSMQVTSTLNGDFLLSAK